MLRVVLDGGEVTVSQVRIPSSDIPVVIYFMLTSYSYGSLYFRIWFSFELGFHTQGCTPGSRSMVFWFVWMRLAWIGFPCNPHCSYVQCEQRLDYKSSVLAINGTKQEHPPDSSYAGSFKFPGSFYLLSWPTFTTNLPPAKVSLAETDQNHEIFCPSNTVFRTVNQRL